MEDIRRYITLIENAEKLGYTLDAFHGSVRVECGDCA